MTKYEYTYKSGLGNIGLHGYKAYRKHKFVIAITIKKKMEELYQLISIQKSKIALFLRYKVAYLQDHVYYTH